MTTYQDNKNIAWLYSAVLILCIIQPVLDVISYWLDVWKSDNTVSLALRFIVFLAVVITAWIISSNKKPYFILTIISVVLVALHITACVSCWHEEYNLSWAFSDIANYIRVLQIPFFTFAFITCFKTLSDKKRLYNTFELGLLINLVIIAVVELISTLTGTDPHTYSNKSLGVLGWFYFANSQSAILCAIIPIAIGYSYKKHNYLGIILTSALSFIVLYMFGTRLSFLGIFVIAIGIIITLMINDHQNNKKILILCMALGIVVCGILLIVSFAFSVKNSTEQNEGQEK